MMKKKLLALLCALSTLIGVLALSATANSDSTTTEQKFYVGYAKVDINPYYNEVSDRRIMPVPLRGTTTATKRLAKEDRIDDNGSGSEDFMAADGTGGDGLFLTCIAISNSKDSFKDAVLLFSMDAIGDMGHTADARDKIVNALGARTGITQNQIMVSGTHAHSGVDLTRLTDDTFKNGTTNIVNDDKYDYGVTGAESYSYLETYYNRLMDKFVTAAEAAMNDCTAATISKGQIEANESGVEKADKMNFVRHYVEKKKYGNTYFVSDSHFNTNVNYTTLQGHISDVDNTLYAITFQFDDTAKKPIVLVNWRNHPQIASNFDNYVVSSDYINAFRYQMELAGYRAAFFQGTGGNTQPYGKMDGEDWANDKTLKAVHDYGKLLADVTKVCLNNNMGDPVKVGQVQTMQNVYEAKRVTFSWNVETVVEAANKANSWPDKYTYIDEYGKEQTDYIINANHASRILTHYKNRNSKLTMEIDTILIGPEIAIVTCPGEPFDRYSQQAADEIAQLWETNSMLTLDQYRDKANQYNDWEKLYTYNEKTGLGIKGAEYGEPLIFGYTNQHVTYIPNALTYHYNTKISNTYATQCYENYMTPLAEGEGERMVANLAVMLDAMVNDGKTGFCEHCDRDVTWYPMDAANTASQNAHTYLKEDATIGSHISVMTNMCIDLAGKKLYNEMNAANSNVFDVATGATLSIFDSSATEDSLGTGEAVGSNNTGSGGVISLAPGSTVNIYGGTFSSAAPYENTGDSKTEQGTMFGGIIYSKGGTINMYGGKIVGGPVLRGGGAICLHGVGAHLNVYGGTITKDTSGGCVSFRELDGDGAIADNAITVGGTAVIAEIDYSIYKNGSGVPTAENFKIVDVPGDHDGQTPFTGSVVLKATNIASVDKVGTISVPLGEGASVTDSNSNDLRGKLLENYDAAGVVLNGEATSYGTLEEAIARVEDGYVILYRNADEDVTISNDITIDLNCYDINNVIVEDGATLTVKDTKKDNDLDYGVVKNFSGNVEPAENYLKYTDDEGTSFHAYMMELDTVGLSPEKAGMYYKAIFDGDATLKSKIESFGVALRINKAPDESTMKPGHYTVLDSEYFGVGVVKSATLVDILKSTNVLSTNKSNAERQIYGRAYIKLTNGDYLFSKVDEDQAFSLREFVERYSETNTVDDLAANTALLELYRKYSAVMSDWEIGNIEAAYLKRQEQETTATNILLIGNSSCFYWTDELRGMLEAAGYPNITIYNLYYSGASLEQHYNWWKTDTKACKLLCEGKTIKTNVNINDVWSLRQWDYVSFLQASKVYNYKNTFDEAMNTITPYFGKLLNLAEEKAPYAKIFWQESWASDIGFTSTTFNMENSDQQDAMASMIQRVSAQVSKTYGLPVVPLSSAWQSLRNNEDFLALAAARSERLGLKKEITLCTRNIDGGIDNDFDHDGDVGGGQYLNACIFYEMFTGEDCRENTYRPQYVENYSLTEAEIVMLQEAAHNAVNPNN